jgi:hypothetical protein
VRLGPAIEAVMRSERDLADSLSRVAERHRADHDVFHLSHLLARWSQGHLVVLEPLARRHGVGDRADGKPQLPGPREPGLLLLADLRELHLRAAATSLDWTVLGQAAQAARDSELLDCVSLCHPETLRTLKWTVTKIKPAAPQALS